MEVKYISKMDCLILIANLEDILHAGLDGMQEEEGVCLCVWR